MRTSKANSGKALMRSEEWMPLRASRTKLETFKEAIFNLRFNKMQSITSIKKFLKSEGVTTSAAAISKFIKSRFTSGSFEKEKTQVARHLENLRKGAE